MGDEAGHLAVQDIQVVIGHLRHSVVAFLQRRPLNELWEHLCLKDFDAGRGRGSSDTRWGRKMRSRWQGDRLVTKTKHTKKHMQKKNE